MSFSDALVDEWIDEQGTGENELANCTKLLFPDERLLIIIAARGDPGLNRLAMTDRRIILYPEQTPQQARSFSYGQISDFHGKRNNFLHHLGEIAFLAEGQMWSSETSASNMSTTLSRFLLR